MRSQRPQHSVPPWHKNIELPCAIQGGVKLGKRVQYIRTAGEKQLFCAFRTDFGAKRYGTPQAVHFYIYRSHCSCFPPASAHSKKRAGQRRLGEVRLIFLLGYLQQRCLFSSSFYIPFIPQRGLHLGADLAKIGAGLLCALQNRLYLRFLFFRLLYAS